MIIRGDRRNIQKDKHHCNTPPIWALRRCGTTQSSPQWRHMKTQLAFAKKHLETRFSGLMNLNSKHHVWRKPGTAHHLQSAIPKVKCAGSSLMLCISKYWDSINENLVQSIQNLRLVRRFTFQQDKDPKHTARVAYRQLCECSWVAQPEPWLERNQIFLEKPENVRLPHPTWQSLRGEEVRWRMADHFQILMFKVCRIIPKKTWGSKGASPKYWVKGLNTYAIVLISVFYF